MLFKINKNLIKKGHAMRLLSIDYLVTKTTFMTHNKYARAIFTE